jgi:hypothetical protein
MTTALCDESRRKGADFGCEALGEKVRQKFVLAALSRSLFNTEQLPLFDRIIAFRDERGCHGDKDRRVKGSA